MPLIKTTPAGKIITKTDSGIEVILNPGELRKEYSELRRKGSKSDKSSKFKLLTVRKLTQYTAESINNTLLETSKRLDQDRLNNGSPTTYPKEPDYVVDPRNSYGVFIDEDLYGQNNPVYAFTTDTLKIKSFITTSGGRKDDWSVHLAHLDRKIQNPDGTFSTYWKLVSIESSSDGRVYHILNSTELPKCFQYNFDVESVNYLGGGTWSAMAVDIDDRIPVYAVAPVDERYIPVGKVFSSLGEPKAKSIVAYSMTPTYVFTWARGVLKINKRTRDSNQVFDSNQLKSDGVIGFTRTHSYSLEIPYRVDNKTSDNDINEFSFNEFSTGKATYVGNTNAPGIASQYQNPDYGTDKKRLSISKIEMVTNVIRPTEFSYKLNPTLTKLPKSTLSYAPVICASPDMAYFISYNFGEATGNINHPFELKSTPGKRGFQYGEDYKLWWGYGKVVETYPYGDTNRYRRLKSPGFDANGNRLPDLVKIGSMFDLGELRKHPTIPNAVETTWNALANPPTGFFGIFEGELSFWVVYLNPPLIGHQGVYYYHVNPSVIGGSSGSAELNEFGDMSSERQNQNVLKYLYSQMLGALGGGGLSSLDIGNVLIAANDNESIIVKSPSPAQKAELGSAPETFPSGYFDGDLYGYTLDNTNKGVITIYDSSGNSTVSYELS